MAAVAAGSSGAADAAGAAEAGAVAAAGGFLSFGIGGGWVVVPS